MFEHLLVIELAGVLAGPSVGMFFAELGARVIKVENPAKKGDVTRHWKLPSESADTDISAYFSAVNWGKESLSLDLASETGREVIYALVAKADILLSSFIPGSAERLELDAARLLAINPRLICAEINGYGRESSRAAYDAIIQAEAGFTYMNGQQEQVYKMPVALMDVLAAHQLKEAILLALIRRSETGLGGRVSVSLLDAGIAALVNQATNWMVSGEAPKPVGSDHPNIVPYGTIFRTREQEAVVLAVGTDAQFTALCEVLGMEVIPDWQHNQGRVRCREAINAALRTAIARWEREALLAALRDDKVPAGAVNDMAAVFAQPQSERLRLEEGKFKGLRGLVAEADFLSPLKKLNPPPHLGQHNPTILGAPGFSPERIGE